MNNCLYLCFSFFPFLFFLCWRVRSGVERRYGEVFEWNRYTALQNGSMWHKCNALLNWLYHIAIAKHSNSSLSFSHHCFPCSLVAHRSFHWNRPLFGCWVKVNSSIFLYVCIFERWYTYDAQTHSYTYTCTLYIYVNVYIDIISLYHCHCCCCRCCWSLISDDITFHNVADVIVNITIEYSYLSKWYELKQ